MDKIAGDSSFKNRSPHRVTGAGPADARCGSVDPVDGLDESLRIGEDIVVLHDKDGNPEKQFERDVGILGMQAALAEEERKSRIAKHCRLSEIAQRELQMSAIGSRDGINRRIEVVRPQRGHGIDRESSLRKNHDAVAMQAGHFAVHGHASLRGPKHRVQQCGIGSGKLRTGVVITVKAQRKPTGVLLEDPDDPLRAAPELRIPEF